MSVARDPQVEVLIVGAGPTGLVLALWLTRLQARIRILDRTLQPGTTSRALAVQARTLEFYRLVGLADAVVRHARPAVAVNLWVAGKRAAHASFGDLGKALSPFPNPLIFPQDEHEQLLVERLQEAGIEVERGTELVDFAEAAGHIVAHLKRTDGSIETCEAAYLTGCDGARSTVREKLKIGFPGGTYAHLFYVADVDAGGPVANGELHVGLDKADFLAVFPLQKSGRLRLVGTARDGAGRDHEKIPQPREQKMPQPPEALSWEDVSKRVIEWMHVDVRRVNWFSTYRVHHRVATHFREARVFLLGDAAHIHSPVGGQGMNTGIGDAVNLAWKLAAVLRGRAAEAILDTYEPERIAFARRLVATTDRAFSGVTSSGVLARRLRLNVVPLVMPLLFAFRAARRLMFRTVSQTAVNYRDSRLSEGRAGALRGGDRLPWVPGDRGDADGDNFGPLRSLDWQVHVYGVAGAAVQSACTARKLPLHTFPWSSRSGRAGLRRNVAYLVRPDGYVGLVDARGDGAAIHSYLDRYRLVCGNGAGDR